MEQSPWDAGGCSFTQEIPHLFWTLKNLYKSKVMCSMNHVQFFCDNEGGGVSTMCTTHQF